LDTQSIHNGPGYSLSVSVSLSLFQGQMISKLNSFFFFLNEKGALTM
jgi:hypothetical protein